MKITKKGVLLNIVNAWFEKGQFKSDYPRDRQSFIDGWRACEEHNITIKKERKKQVLSESWVDYKKGNPIEKGYYLTKVNNDEIVDYWDGTCFVYNNELITYWKIKEF